jgi:hypothetical protein
VGLDENTSYTFRVFLGNKDAGVDATDDELKAAAGEGIAPLTAEIGVRGGVNYWGDLSLKSNRAWFGTVIDESTDTPIGDYNDMNKTPTDGRRHSTTGQSEYVLTVPAVDPGTPANNLKMAYFKMEYEPFGLDDQSWTAIAATNNAAPV